MLWRYWLAQDIEMTITQFGALISIYLLVSIFRLLTIATTNTHIFPNTYTHKQTHCSEMPGIILLACYPPYWSYIPLCMILYLTFQELDCFNQGLWLSVHSWQETVLPPHPTCPKFWQPRRVTQTSRKRKSSRDFVLVGPQLEGGRSNSAAKVIKARVEA